MSILDGKPNLRTFNSDGYEVDDYEVEDRPQKQNNNPNKNRRRDRYRVSEHHYGGKETTRPSKSSYLPTEEKQNVDQKSNEPDVDKRADEINDFCEKFLSCDRNYRVLQDVIRYDFPEVINYVKYYYGAQNKPVFISALNRFINVICTTTFANTLSNVLDSGVWESEYESIWQGIAFGISLALETNYDRMHTDTIKKYVNVILPRIWKPEIDDIMSVIPVTSDLILDLFIAIPIANDDKVSNANIDAFYYRFLDKMLIHAEDNIQTLNWEIQTRLFNRMFGKKKTSNKVVGRYLAQALYDENTLSKPQRAVYKDFMKLIFTKLNNLDIEDIENTLAFAFNTVDETNIDIPMFSEIDVEIYENVNTALNSLIKKQPNFSKFVN